MVSVTTKPKGHVSSIPIFLPLGVSAPADVGLEVHTNTRKWATVACHFCTSSHFLRHSFTQNSSVGL